MLDGRRRGGNQQALLQGVEVRPQEMPLELLGGRSRASLNGGEALSSGELEQKMLLHEQLKLRLRKPEHSILPRFGQPRNFTKASTGKASRGTSTLLPKPGLS